MRILELFAGIGGVAAAVQGRAEIVCAVDQDEHAHLTYTANWPHPARRWNILGLKAERLARLQADLWWMSPPCQPFTVRGARRDLDDRRCQPLLHVLDLLDAVRPRHVALENVSTFQGSRAHALVLQTLSDAGYTVRERLLCASELGVPNQRPRYYLLASREELPPWRPPRKQPLALGDHLDPEPDPSLYVPADLLARYHGALPITDLSAEDPQTFCFTGAYACSPVYSGSYLRDDRGVRWFSPTEIARLLGFPSTFHLPGGIPRPKQYRLVGNSLSVFAVREVLEPVLPSPTGAPHSM